MNDGTRQHKPEGAPAVPMVWIGPVAVMAYLNWPEIWQLVSGVLPTIAAFVAIVLGVVLLGIAIGWSVRIGWNAASRRNFDSGDERTS